MKVKRSYVDKSAFLYVHLLKLKLEAVCREYSNLIKKNSNPTKVYFFLYFLIDVVN